MSFGASIVDTLTERGRVPIMAQRFLESIRDGDGVISCLLGEPIWSLRSGIGERAGGLERCLPGLLSPLSELAKPCKNWS